MYHYQKDRLPNGLRVVTIALPHLHTAALLGYIKLGSRYETLQTNGLSHFLEHMLFRGTASYPDSYDLNDAVEQLGGNLNATTCRDHTYFDTRIPPSSLEPTIEIFKEIFTSPRFIKIDVERNAILEELSSDLDEDGNLICVDSLSRLALFPDHPLGYPIIGNRQTVENFQLSDVKTHFQKHYTAQNMILCAAGPITHEAVLQAAQKHLSTLTPGEAIQSPSPTILPQGPCFQYVENHGSQTQLCISFRIPGDRDPMFPALQLLWRVLDDGMGARLHRRIYDDLGLAYEISATIDPYFDVGLFDVDAAVQHENAAALIRETLKLLADLREHGPSPAELEKAKRRYALDLHASLDSPEAMAGYFGGGELFATPEPFERRLARIQALTREDLQAAAAKTFQQHNVHITAVGQLKKKQQAECQKAMQTL